MAAVERLESRQLLTAASIVHNPELQQLEITGTDSDDVIRTEYVFAGGETERTPTAGRLELSDIDPVGVKATITSGSETVELTVDLRQLTQIILYARAGNDIFDNDTGVASIAFGEAGDDTLTGGSGNDALFGGDGIDLLDGGEEVVVQDVRTNGFDVLYQDDPVKTPTLLVVTHGQQVTGRLKGDSKQDWQDWAEQVAQALADAGSYTETFFSDWDTFGANTKPADQLADRIDEFIAGRKQKWDVLFFGHSRGAILQNEAADRVSRHENLGQVHQISLDPTAATLFSDQYPDAIAEISSASVYDDGLQLLPATSDGRPIAGDVEYHNVFREMKDDRDVQNSFAWWLKRWAEVDSALGTADGANTVAGWLGVSTGVASESLFFAKLVIKGIRAMGEHAAYHMAMEDFYLRSDYFPSDIRDFSNAKTIGTVLPDRMSTYRDVRLDSKFEIRFSDLLATIIETTRYGGEIGISVAENFVDGWIDLIRTYVTAKKPVRDQQAALLNLDAPSEALLNGWIDALETYMDHYFDTFRKWRNGNYGDWVDAMYIDSVRDIFSRLDALPREGSIAFSSGMVHAIQKSTAELLAGRVVTLFDTATGHVKTVYEKGERVLRETHDAGGRLVRETWNSAGKAVKTYYKNGKAYLRKTWSSGNKYVKETWDSAGTAVKTYYKNGKAFLRKTWSRGNKYVKETWNSSGKTVKTYYKSGKAYLRKTWSRGNRYVKESWSSSGKAVKTYYKNGKAYLRKTWSRGNKYVKETWSSSGKAVKTYYKKGKAYLRKTWSRGNKYVKETWNSSGKAVKTYYRNGKAYLRKTWSRGNKYVKETWSSSGKSVKTYYKNGKAYLRKTWKKGGRYVREEWNKRGDHIRKEYRHGRLVAQKAWDSAGRSLRRVTDRVGRILRI